MRRLTKAVLAGSGAFLSGCIPWSIHSTRTRQSVPSERLRILKNPELRQSHHESPRTEGCESADGVSTPGLLPVGSQPGR